MNNTGAFTSVFGEFSEGYAGNDICTALICRRQPVPCCIGDSTASKEVLRDGTHSQCTSRQPSVRASYEITRSPIILERFWAVEGQCKDPGYLALGFAVRVRSAGQKYGPTCHQRDRADVTEFVTLVRLSSLGQHVGVLALAGYKRRKSALTANPILAQDGGGFEECVADFLSHRRDR